jgi:hypothetical protein
VKFFTSIYGFLIAPMGAIAAVVFACAGTSNTPAVVSVTATDIASAFACNLAHWGEPFPNLVADCWQGDAAAAADAVAVIEMLFEKQSAVDAGSASVAGIQARFPYGNEPAVVTALAVRRAKGQ